MTTQHFEAELLLIVTERVRPGAEEAYGQIESHIAELCARMHCPHPYLALERSGEPKEIWWLNAFASNAEKERVEQAYAANEPLMAELLRLSKEKASLTEQPLTVLARYRRDLSASSSWDVTGARFFVVTISSGRPDLAAVVVEALDGQLYSFAPTATVDAAEEVASRGAGSAVLAVRPQWSIPARSWMAEDPEFWNASPAARGRDTVPHQ